MKITHIITSLKIGGAERFVIDLCALQKKSNNDVSIISFGNESDPLMDVCKEKAIPVKLIPSNIFKRNIETISQLKNTDVIHIHSPYALRTSLFSLGILSNRKIIYTRHGEGKLSSKQWKAIHKIAQLFIDHVTFVSKKGQDIFLNTQKLKKLPHHVIENGTNTEDVCIQKDHQFHKLRIGSVGRMVKLKQQITLLRAMQYLVPKNLANIEIHFFGDGECLNKLQEYAKNNLANDIVTFHGIEKDRNIIYNTFDLLVVTSETEGLSLAIIEAMNFSRPVLATSVGGNSRLVFANKTGFLFDYDNEKQLASLIEKLSSDSELLKLLGENARRHIIENFSLEKTANQYMELYT